MNSSTHSAVRSPTASWGSADSPDPDVAAPFVPDRPSTLTSLTSWRILPFGSMRTIMVTGIVVTLMATAAPASAAIEQFEISSVTLNAYGVEVEGTITCDEGELAYINLTVTRSVGVIGDDARARGHGFLGCTGVQQDWNVLARIRYGFSSCAGLPVEIFYKVRTLQDHTSTDFLVSTEWDQAATCGIWP